MTRIPRMISGCFLSPYPCHPCHPRLIVSPFNLTTDNADSTDDFRLLLISLSVLSAPSAVRYSGIHHWFRLAGLGLTLLWLLIPSFCGQFIRRMKTASSYQPGIANSSQRCFRLFTLLLSLHLAGQVMPGAEA